MYNFIREDFIMLEKISQNKYTICTVLAFVALALGISATLQQLNLYIDIRNGYESDYAFTYLVSTIKYGVITTSTVFLIAIAIKRTLDKNMIAASLSFYTLGDLADIAKYIQKGTFDYTDVIWVGINIIILILGILALSNRRYLLTAITFLAIDIAFNLVDVFIGSVMGLSIVIIATTLSFCIYFCNKEENNYYDEYTN